MNKRCENCRYYEHEDIDDGYVCVNGDSDYCTEWVEPDHCCDEWRDRYKVDRCCCTCDRNKRKPDGNGHVDCICEIDGHRIGYVENFEHSCQMYALDRVYKPVGKWYKGENKCRN